VLEVEALDGEPGVNSAHYAGEQRSADDNIDLLLQKLKDQHNRKARFRTIITLLEPSSNKAFEGMVKGEILTERRGNMGFGYDPVFLPDGYTRTFAEMTLQEKNKISHRAMAMAKLIEYLKMTYGS
jgi:XTP/dITP diphosphohydrolase